MLNNATVRADCCQMQNYNKFSSKSFGKSASPLLTAENGLARFVCY